ncbi:MAG TPA: NDP-hexose 2,3-dehydratase family protein [Chloroflexota bacterium]
MTPRERLQALPAERLQAPPALPAFLRSALSEQNPFQSTDEAVAWLRAAGESRKLQVEPIPFADLDEWSFEPETGDLVHRSGKFFRVQGLRVGTDSEPGWDQPIINQPEVGILGIIAREIDGQLYFLMQAKLEPGNPLGVQLTPTVQATRSNYTQVHQGARPRYVEYFLARGSGQVLVDELQFEQGSVFLRKRNRNIVIQVKEDVPAADGYCWLTLGQIKKLLQYPNLVGMDTRLVIACLPLGLDVQEGGAGIKLPPPAGEGWGEGIGPGLACSEFGAKLIRSASSVQGAHNDEEVLSWLTELRTQRRLRRERIGLNSVRGWQQTDAEIVHEARRFFRVLAVSVEADSREVAHWKQPLIGSTEQGLIAFLTQEIAGTLHFLVRGNVEPGNTDRVAIGPSVQCALGFDRLSELPMLWPPFTELALDAPAESIRYSCIQSEEGGRFYHVENEYRFVELPASQHLDLPENYLWVNLRQLQTLLRYGFVNVEARNLLACLSLT